MPENDLPPHNPIVAQRDGDLGQRQADNPRASNSAIKTPGSPSTFIIFIVMILVLGLAGLGWFSWHQSVQQTQLQQRFNELAAKIDSTDELLSESGTALSVKLVEQKAELDKHWSEIKKLWGVANDRNKKAIKALEQITADSTSKNKELVRNLSSAITEQEKLTARIVDIGSDSLASTVRIDELDERIVQVDDALKNLHSTLGPQQKSFESRLRASEKAIEAIDAFRRQTNQSLDALRRAAATP
jgi:chromosome segregation ATPase